MQNNKDKPRYGSTRRKVLKTVAASVSVVAADSVSAQQLTEVEGTGGYVDGWRTTGGNKLTKISEADAPGAVSAGEEALLVDVRGDLHPHVENNDILEDLDLLEQPTLAADVLAINRDRDSNLVFQMKLHHRETPADGRGQGSSGGNAEQGKSVLIAESRELTIATLSHCTLYWDLSGLTKEELSSADWLEFLWYLEDEQPDRGPRGRQPGDYHGNVIIDNVRATDISDVSGRAIRDKRRRLNREHGLLIERKILSREGRNEEGVMVFQDGTEVGYENQRVGEDQFLYTLGDEIFKKGEGW